MIWSYQLHGLYYIMYLESQYTNHDMYSSRLIFRTLQKKKKNSQSENSEQSMEIILSFKDDTHIFKVY